MIVMPIGLMGDAKTGEVFPCISQRRSGRWYVRKMPAFMRDVNQASARTLEQRANFAEAAHSAWGKPFTASLPPAAEAVRDRMGPKRETRETSTKGLTMRADGTISIRSPPSDSSPI